MVIFGGLFGRYRGALLAEVGILFYTLLVGAGASVMRAALMGGLTLLAVQIGRRQNGLNDHCQADRKCAEFHAHHSFTSKLIPQHLKGLKSSVSARFFWIFHLLIALYQRLHRSKRDLRSFARKVRR